MRIRQALPGDLFPVVEIIGRVKQAMREGGNPQWDSDYPGEKEYEEDIRKGELFICETDDGQIGGFMCLNQHVSPEYADVTWQTSSPCLGIHRLAVNTEYRGRGIASALFAFAEQFAREQGCRSLHLDTFTPNRAAQQLFLRNGCRFVGEIYMKGRTIPYRCYEKEV